MTTAIVILMLLSYVLICSEHATRVNKATVALFCGVCGWVMLICAGPQYISSAHNAEFAEFLSGETFSIAAVNEYIYRNLFLKHMVQLCSIVMYLLATMSIVSVLSDNGCFDFITSWSRSKSAPRTLWSLAFFSFVLSANLDNLTSAVVMLTILNKLVVDGRQRMWLGAVIVIATSCGGCFTVIGDVTSLLVWTRGAVTPTNYSGALALPAIVATIVPTYLIGRKLPDHLGLKRTGVMFRGDDSSIATWQRYLMLALGIGGLWFVPTFYRLTMLPPFLGALCVLGVLWVANEIFNRKNILADQPVVSKCGSLQYEILQMIMFFVGVSLCVCLLIEVGAMREVAAWCDRYIHNIYIMSVALGVVSSVMDNVALVMSAISIYPVLDDAQAVTGYASSFVQNGQYWHLIALSGNVGGCLLPFGSTAGYALMRSEDISLSWYVRNITLKVLVGWLLALGVYFLVDYFLR